jgi:hypothetical protein
MTAKSTQEQPDKAPNPLTGLGDIMREIMAYKAPTHSAPKRQQ